MDWTTVPTMKRYMTNPIFVDVRLDNVSEYWQRNRGAKLIPDGGSIECLYCSYETLSTRASQVEKIYGINNDSFEYLSMDLKFWSQLRGRVKSLSFFDYHSALYPNEKEKVECSGCKRIVYKLIMNHMFCLSRLKALPKRIITKW